MNFNYSNFYDRSSTNSEKYQARDRIFGENDILPLWVADMDIATPPFIIDAISNRLNHPILGYEEFPTSAKNAQVSWFKKRHNFNIDIDSILYSPSTVASIGIIIDLFSDLDDEIIIMPPVYPMFAKSIKDRGRLVINNPLKLNNNSLDYSIDFEDLESKISSKTKLIIFCSPHNPVGRVWGRDELEKLGNLAIKYGIKIFSDEVHCDLVYRGYKHTPLASISKEISNITITSFGVGKSFNISGLSISTLVIPNIDLKSMVLLELNKIHFGEGNIIGHISLESAYNQGAKWIDGVMDYFDANIDRLESLLNRYSNLIEFKRPQGTYLVWLNCKNMGLSDSELKYFFVKKAKIGVGFGLSFGISGRNFIRLNIAVPTKIMDKLLINLENALSYYQANS